MLEKIIGYSIRNKFIIGLFVLGLIAWGIKSAIELPIDAVPDITNNQVQVITQSPNLASLEIEKYITYPIEVATSNIPGLEETRSISRFGLSVVTLVFQDHVDIYWARAQVAERLKDAQQNIPAGVGEPMLAPVSTGLSEIYQYVIRPVNIKDTTWDLTELRTIQDWQLKRELLRVPGVADVSSFGGYMKQFHVKLNPQLLQSSGIAIHEVMAALEQGSSNTGASYIEKGDRAYFIRGLGMAENISDIENIVVKNSNGVPVLMRDIGKVEISHAMRFGAMTQNGKGEAVGGIILMLKGENSSAVIDRVKIKMDELQKTLPKGLVVEAFLDREVLVKKAISTVVKNLVEGGIIVIFVLILLLGNLRAGFIVASVIPLSMLFAIILMRLFGVSGNLMSLGAIDFGLIVDGAVIIVEIVVRKIHEHLHRHHQFATKKEFEHTVFTGASEIMKSAAFGQFIILIVYIPILALTGIEGKMFKPMAITVSFAIIGAFILSLTYVPMMSALLLRSNKEEKESFAERMINRLRKKYVPVVELFLTKTKMVIASAVVLLVAAVLLFNTLGGEFIPQLDEGDYAVEMRLLPGSSLSQSIHISQIAQRKLLEEFPDEIKTVVGKIGTSEIPTDPMPIEATDLIIVMKPRDEWKKASNKAEMDEAIESVLAEIPGVAFSLQQPIQMRFNELMTNAKTDVVIKLFGKDLDILALKGEQIAAVISPVEGVKDVQTQKITGLPQIQIRYNRQQMANYGITVQRINEYIETAIGGKKAGIIFENEQGYDLVLKLQDDSRKNSEDFSNIFISNDNGLQVPLKELAEITTVKGPAEISRDDTKRKISIGFNVRGRDVESVVHEIEDILDKKIQLPAGYSLKYGGQFENLNNARNRLLVVVPISLLVILLLLFFSFGSFQQALLIFSAIPLAAVGGAFSLWLRDMPFSISAGVGFIALFGVAVLNGIVLIAHFNQLKMHGMHDIQQRILEGVSDRFRPVLMTAMVASMGFLPMALSNGAGAEVQKPLATVVIGGLISSTLLTLLVLPVLYNWVERRTKKSSHKGIAVALALVIFSAAGSKAQTPALSLQQAIDSALSKHPLIKAADAQVQQMHALRKTAFNPPPMELLMESPTGTSMRPGVLQNFDFPLVYSKQSQLYHQQENLAQKEKSISVAALKKQVRVTYADWQYAALCLQTLQQQDSLFDALLKSARITQKAGATSGIDLLNVSTEAAQVKHELQLAQQRYKQAMQSLKNTCFLQTDYPHEVVQQVKITTQEILIADASSTPYHGFAEQQLRVSEKQLQLEKWRMAPGFTLGYLNQAGNSTPMDMRLRYGIRVPLFFWSNLAAIKSARLNVERSNYTFQNTALELQTELSAAQSNWQQATSALQYYEQNALPQSAELRKASTISFNTGDISQFQHLYNLNKTHHTALSYLQAVKEYHYSVAQLLYLKGE
jgi:cobalt-zinc-cadmium resistance protein CzcA